MARIKINKGFALLIIVNVVFYGFSYLLNRQARQASDRELKAVKNSPEYREAVKAVFLKHTVTFNKKSIIPQGDIAGNELQRRKSRIELPMKDDKTPIEVVSASASAKIEEHIEAPKPPETDSSALRSRLQRIRSQIKISPHEGN